MIARRRFAALIGGLPLLLAGCGWTPMYADPETGAADAELRAVRVHPILERTGQRLETALRHSLNPDNIPTDKRFELLVTIQLIRQDLGIQSQGLGTRGEVQAIANMTLADIKAGANVMSNTLRASDSFDIQANGYSTVVAEDDARVRIVEQLRQEIVTRLTAFLQRRVAGKI
jgi:LPS-assembly lipoprotein